jgi:chorismate dehydratase
MPSCSTIGSSERVGIEVRGVRHNLRAALIPCDATVQAPMLATARGPAAPKRSAGAAAHGVNVAAYHPMMSSSAVTAPVGPVRIGVVSFLNTLPLIDGLERLADVQLRHSVPSLLVDQLIEGEVELALCSSIDHQRSSVPLVAAPVGLLGCEGATLTVRLYSTRPLAQVREVHCDTDSHTSIALLRILLLRMHGIEPTLTDYNAREHVAHHRPLDWPDAMLLIGDKVVSDSPPAVRYPHQLDLGAAWHDLTGLPFVFAFWMARADADLSRIRLAARVLDHQRRHNHERLDGMIHRHATGRGWPADLARSYLREHLVFAWNDARRAGLERFYAEAAEAGLIGSPRSLTFVETD